MAKSFKKCFQCGSTKSTITKDDLKAAGLQTCEKRVSRRFCSIACYTEYATRVPSFNDPISCYVDSVFDGGYDEDDFDFGDNYESML